jgi:hypothetical protein
MAVNNHSLALYQGNLITEGEARAFMGRDPLVKSQDKELFLNRVQIPLAEAQAEAKADAAIATASAKNQPTNQKGSKMSKSAPVNPKKSSSEPAVRKRKVASRLQLLHEDLSTYVQDQLTKGGPLDSGAVDSRLVATGADIQSILKDDVQDILQAGMERYRTLSGTTQTFFVGQAIKDRFHRRCVIPATEPLVGLDKDQDVGFISSRIRLTKDDHQLVVSSTLGSWQERWDRVGDRLEVIADRFGFLQAAWLDKTHSVYWNLTDACDTCKQRFKGPITPVNATYFGLLSLHCPLDLRLEVQTGTDSLTITPETRILSNESIQLILHSQDSLDLTSPHRFLRICLDSGSDLLVPTDIDSTITPGSISLTLPNTGGGHIELWDHGRIILQTPFAVPQAPQEI